ncbi:MAG: cyclic nucleotide-binding domain-containing protein [Oscillospiraceae bacterium]|nr:cyclic nucleotide-binding domain-containing protein [Oscillospiraceae bacterium]
MGESWELVCQKGDVVIREGDYGVKIFKLISGSARVLSNYGEDSEALLAELHAGDYFGEMAVLEVAHRSATVVAAEDRTRIAVFDASDLSGYLSENKGEINSLARQLSSRLRKMTIEYLELCSTLRELGRLDTSVDQLSGGLMARIKKFARAYLLGQPAAGASAELGMRIAPQKCDSSLALRSAVFQKGEVIFREGTASDCMYYIYSGRVGIYSGCGTPAQHLLAELSPEEFFGEMGLFEDAQRSATAIALSEDTCVELVSEKDLVVIFEKNPALAMLILQHLSSRLRKLTADYLKACKTLAQAERELEQRRSTLSPEVIAQTEYLNQLMFAPELLF